MEPRVENRLKLCFRTLLWWSLLVELASAGNKTTFTITPTNNYMSVHTFSAILFFLETTFCLLTLRNFPLLAFVFSPLKGNMKK